MVIIGGLISATLLTLILLPTLYRVIETGVVGKSSQPGSYQLPGNHAPAGNWAIAFGVQVPVTREREANYRVLGYLLYELPPFRFE